MLESWDFAEWKEAQMISLWDIDSCHGRVSGINKICIPKFLLLP